MSNNYTIYKLTFLNGKIYIGQTSKPVEERWQNGEGYKGQDVYVPIILEGWNNVKKEILHTDLTREQADKLEKYYIKKYNSIQNGYNKASGGSSANKEKIIEVNIEKTLEELFEYIPKLSKDLNGNAFKLVFYFFSKNYSTFTISPKEITQTLGISRQSILDSFKELQQKNYIIKLDENNYIFQI